VLLSQLNRDVDARKPPIPNLSDLRETGALEQDANVVIFIYRPWYYKIKEDEGGMIDEETAHLIIAKNRGGKTGSVKVRFIAHLTQFADLENTEPAF
jgi:replicative DNA helicase